MGVGRREVMWRESGAWKSKTDRGLHATMRDEGVSSQPWLDLSPRKGRPHAAGCFRATEGGMDRAFRWRKNNSDVQTKPQRHADARRVVFPQISTIHTKLLTLRAPGDRSSVHERTRRSADPARLGCEASSQVSYPVKRKRSLRLHGALQRPHPRYRRTPFFNGV